MDNLKELRNEKGLTQQQVADLVGISLRSYKYYENEPDKQDTIKYKYIYNMLKEINPIDEEHGILSVAEITEKCAKVLEQYGISYCYLFGSYAKGTAKETSDVDLIVSKELRGLKFFGMVEDLRESLHKRVDVLVAGQLENNPELLNAMPKYKEKSKDFVIRKITERVPEKISEDIIASQIRRLQVRHQGRP